MLHRLHWLYLEWHFYMMASIFPEDFKIISDFFRIIINIVGLPVLLISLYPTLPTNSLQLFLVWILLKRSPFRWSMRKGLMVE